MAPQRSRDTLVIVLPKVYSYRRSGTHLLLSLIWRNFDVGDTAEAVHVPEMVWYSTGQHEVIVPWAKLFVDHDQYDASRVSVAQAIYIMRHPVDCLYSNWRSLEAQCDKDEYVVASADSWRRHVDSFVQAGIPAIQYEWLCYSPQLVLQLIQRLFGLRPYSDEWTLSDEPIGWSPGEGAMQKPPYPRALYADRLQAATLEQLRQQLGACYYGYLI